jgi:hypothetical protein
VWAVAGLPGGAGAGFGVAFEDLGERHGVPHAAGGGIALAWVMEDRDDAEAEASSTEAASATTT